MNSQASDLGAGMRSGGYRNRRSSTREPRIRIDYTVEFEGGRLVTDCTIAGSGKRDRVTRYISADAKRLFAAYRKSATPKWLVFDRAD